MVNKTTLRSKGFPALFAPKVVLGLEVQFELRTAAEPFTTKLAGWPVSFFCHVLDRLLMIQKLCSTGITFVEWSVDGALRDTARRHCGRV